MRFYLGTHRPKWLGDPAFASVPLFVSAIRLRKLGRRLPTAVAPWALDSGGFSELTQNGAWTVGPCQYASEVRHWQQTVGGLEWAAIQDWMCEPFVIEKTGLSVAEHQRLTVHSWKVLRQLAPSLPWVPVLQGWEPDDYLRCVDLYAAAGTDLTSLPRVGLGSVCRRQGTKTAERIVGRLARLGINLHLFGFKTIGLRKCWHLADSADSLAWSYRGRRAWAHDGVRLCEGDHAGGCGNCPLWALRWRERLLERRASVSLFDGGRS